MMVAMKTEDSLRRGAVMSITKRFGIACSTIYWLWELAESVHATGINSSPELILWGKTLGDMLYIQLSLFG